MNSKDNNRAEHDAELRRLAEEIAWKKAPRSPERLSPGDTQKIIHELRVHQIELEMQNEELRRTQLELDASRERYFNLHDMAPVGYCTLNNQGLVLENNLTAATMLGVPREALNKQPISRFILKEDQDIYYLLSRQLFKHGEPQTCELRMAKKDGTVFWGQLAASRVQSANGTFVCHVILSDITVRKRAEEALQEESRKQYRNLVEGTSDLVTRVDAGGRLLFVNHAILKICGLMPEECIGRPAFDLVIPEDRAATRAAFQAWLESGNEIFKYENRLISTDGRVHYVSWSIRADHDENGNISGFSSTARDIAERKLAEQALRESEQFLKETQVIANLGTYTLDITADRWQSSEVLDKIFGINADFDKSFAGWKSIIHPDWQKIMSDYFLQQVIGRKTRFDKEYKIIRQNDHAERWVHGIGKLKFNDDNQPVAMIGTIRDITERKQDEEALIESNRRLELAYRAAGACYWDWDMTSQRLYWSKELYKLFGLNPDMDNATFDTWKQVIHPDDYEKARSRIEHAIKGKKPHSNEYRIILPDGKVRWISAWGNTAYDPSGQPLRMTGICIDIAERKEAEEALRQSESRFRSYFELPLEGRAISLPDTRWLDVNTTLCDMFGYTKSELTQMTWAEITHPGDLDANMALLNRVLSGGIDGYTMDKRFVHKDGHTVFTILTVQCVRRPDRSVDYFMTVIKDISDRKRAELKLIDALAEAERFREALDHVPAYVFMKDTQFNYIYANRKTLDLFGCSAGELAGRDDTSFFSPDTVNKIRKVDSRVLLGEQASWEFDADDKNGGRHVYWDVKTPIFAEPEKKTVCGLLGIATDITGRKMIEEEIKLKNNELLRINAEKDKFFSIIAHDLRSPFNSFLMLTKIMAQGSPHLTMDKIRGIAAEMRDSAANIFRLLENLLQWAATQQGLMPFNPKPVQLRSIVDECIATGIEAAGSKGIKITRRIPDGMVVFAESNMLQAVIRNLISNAVKFTPKGGKIVLSAKTVGDNNIEISVKDSGIGMNKAIVDNLFHLNVRTNRKGTENEPGTGLGLLLCKEFVEKHGGKIRVESRADKGSVFYFTIPCNAGTEELNMVKDVMPENEKQIKKLKILIAEDDEYSELLITLEVKKFGSEVLIARTGVDAVEACRNNPELDLIMMDIEMPGMDGYEAVRQIRQFNKDVIIIAQTAYALAGDREKAIAAGCDDYIAKPFYKNSLTELLKKHF